MLSRFRSTYQQIMMPLGRLSVRLGLGPDFWTIFSVLLSIVTACVLSQKLWGWGLILALAVNLSDGMDGATARARGTQTDFGTVLDHNMDRYAEFFLLGGILLSGHLPGWLVYAALFGMVMASYVRAKAESVGGLDMSTVGWAGRAEKLILLFVGLGLEGWFNLAGAISWAIALIAIVSHVTFVQRLLHARKQMLPPRTGESQKPQSQSQLT